MLLYEARAGRCVSRRCTFNQNGFKGAESTADAGSRPATAVAAANGPRYHVLASRIDGFQCHNNVRSMYNSGWHSTSAPATAAWAEVRAAEQVHPLRWPGCGLAALAVALTCRLSRHKQLHTTYRLVTRAWKQPAI